MLQVNVMFRKAVGIPLLIAASATISLLLSGAVGHLGPGGPAPGPPDGPPGQDAGPDGPPPDFGPGMFLAPRIMEEADADKDGHLAPEEAAKAAERFIRDADTKKQGSLDAAELGRAVNRLIGPPPGAGPDGPAGDLGPGSFVAPGIVQAADRNKDGRLSAEEAAQAVERFIREAATANKKPLDTQALASVMNRRMGPPPGFGPGGPGGPIGQGRKLLKKFDKDGDGRLDAAERMAARESIKKDKAAERPPGPGFGPPPGFGGESEEPAQPGPRIAPTDVSAYTHRPLYEPSVLRTLFLDFEDKDWEAEMADFYHSDVDVPATLTVDGKKLPGVGVHFRGLSSYFSVREGRKRSLNLSLDFVDPDQRLDGYKTLNLLNSHEDSSFLHIVLFSEIARHYIPAPKANFVRLVINGESWGLYVNTQQFDKKFLAENYGTAQGARWKVPGNPGADGGLRYLGDDVAGYKKRFEIKSSDDKADWKALIALCKILNQTPTEQLEDALKPVLDIEGVLWFLAIDNVLVNGDGYWTRASDYSLYRDPKGVFHVIPHDMNETFGPAMMFGPGPGFGPPGGGRPGAGAEPKGGRPGPGPGMGRGSGPGPPAGDLDPLVGLQDKRMPLRSRLLAVPALKARYLSHVRTLAERWLDWATLGPIVEQYRGLIEPVLEADTRKLSTFAAFQKSVSGDPPKPKEAEPGRGRREPSLRSFAEGRRRYLLNHAEVKQADPEPASR